MIEVRYALSMPEPHTHLFHVRMGVRGAPGETTDLVLPVWTPGSYKVRDFARNVQDFSAGRHEWRKLEKSRWRVLAGGDFAVEYKVWAFELSVQTSHLDADHGYLNGAGVFLYVDGHKDAPVRLEIRPPLGWKIATGLARRGRFFVAPDYDALVDCPIEIGRFRRRTFRVRGVPHRLVIHGRGNFEEDRLVRDVRKIVAAGIRIMRHVPYRDYTFLLHAAGERSGGLEHRNSTSLLFPPTHFRPRGKYENFLELVAHEFFHLWNVKRLRPEALGPFDYEREVYTGLLWVVEGLTSYYAALSLCRAKILAPERYLKRLAERLRKYEDRPGRKRQSLSESSFDAWVKLYQPNENAPNCQMSYYEKGELVGACLDLEIRRRADGRRSLDDVLRLLYDEYGRGDRGFPEPEFKHACERVALGRLDRFFADYVDGVADIPWNRFLGVAGLRLRREPRKAEDGERRRPESAWIGITIQRNPSALLTVATVVEGSPAWQAGLSPKDELVALDGARVTPDEWEMRLDEYRPGNRVRVAVFRSGYLREIPVILGRKENTSLVLRRVERPTARQKRHYESWLGTPWSGPSREK